VLVPARTTGDVTVALARLGRDGDVVHVHMKAAETAAMVTRPLLHAPIVATRHFAAGRGSSAWGHTVAPAIRRSLAAELAISQFVADAADGASEVVRNGVADAAAVPARGHVVLVAQRLEPEKHTQDALDAWARSGLETSGWELWIAGDGSARAELTRRAAGIAGVRFLGHRHDLPHLREQVGVFLATAPAEPFCLSVAEAMAAGLPVVAAAGGGHLETVGASCPELLYPPGDVDACATLLRRLADDEHARRALGGRLRDHQRTALTLNGHVDQLVDVYRRVLAEARPNVAR